MFYNEDPRSNAPNITDRLRAHAHMASLGRGEPEEHAMATHVRPTLGHVSTHERRESRRDVRATQARGESQGHARDAHDRWESQGHATSTQGRQEPREHVKESHRGRESQRHTRATQHKREPEEHASGSQSRREPKEPAVGSQGKREPQERHESQGHAMATRSKKKNETSRGKFDNDRITFTLCS